MFNFKLTPLWLFGIIIIVLVVSMLWYNNASIEGFGIAPADNSDVLKYYPNASTNLVDFGVSDEYFFDTNTGNVIRNYEQTMSVINRIGNMQKYIKSNLETVISTKNDEVHKGSTYPAFSIYEASDDEQLFYISIGTKTFIHSMNLNNNKHGKSYVFDAGRIIKEEFAQDQVVGGTDIQTTLPVVSMNSESIDISGMAVTVMKLTDGLYYDATNQLLIQKTVNTDGTTAGTVGETAAGTVGETTAGTVGENATGTVGENATGTVGENATGTVGETTTGTVGENATGTVGETTTENFALFNNRLSNDELEGFATRPTTDGTTIKWDLYTRAGSQIMKDTYESTAYNAGVSPTKLTTKILNNKDNTLQVVMMAHSSDTVVIILTNVGNAGSPKYKLLGSLRYIGTNLEQPTTATEQPTTSTTETEEKATEEKATDLTDSAMTEFLNRFLHWNATEGSGLGGSQPMSQDYMLKTDYVPMTCPSCSGGGKCENCGNGQGGNHGNHGSGGIVGTTGGVANNIINKTSGLAEKVIDTGAGLAVGGAMLGGAAAVGAIGLGKDATTGAVGLGRDATTGAVGLGKDATTGAVGLGRDATTGAVGLGKDAIYGAKSAAVGVVGLGREVVSGAVGLGKDVVGGTADFIKDTQYANAGGYASGSNGDLQTRKYVRGQGVQPGGMDPYTYNGLLSKRGGSNYMPITSDFSSFR